MCLNVCNVVHVTYLLYLSYHGGAPAAAAWRGAAQTAAATPRQFRAVI